MSTIFTSRTAAFEEMEWLVATTGKPHYIRKLGFCRYTVHEIRKNTSTAGLIASMGKRSMA